MEERAPGSSQGSRISERRAAPRPLSTNQLVKKWLAGGAVVLGVSYIMLSSPGMLAGVAVLLIFALPLLGWVFFGTRRRRTGDLYWKGHVGFAEDDFADRTTFPYVIPTGHRSLGQQGTCPGTLEVRSQGLEWCSGSRAQQRCAVAGRFFLPWSSIVSVDVGDIAGKINLLGGSVRFIVAGDESELYGEFLGSRRALLAGLRRSPLGRP